MIRPKKVAPGHEFAASILPFPCLNPSADKPKNHLLPPRPKRRLPAVLALLAWLICMLVVPGVQAARVKPYPEPMERLEFSWTGLALYQFPSHVDGGGSLSVLTLIFSADLSKQVNEKLGAGVRFSYIFDDYNFSGLTAFPVPHPWSSVHTFGIDFPLIYSLNDKWKLHLIPTGQFSGEDGARFGSSLSYGGVVAVSHVFGPNLELGMGLGVYSNLATISVYPYPIVEIKLGERFKFTNPFPAGPAGPAGGELAYSLNKHWAIGVGGAYRSPRFRLDSNGPLRNGIGEYRSIPIFARLTYEQSHALKIDVYGGVSLFNEIYIHKSNGDEIYRSQQDLAPLIGLSISGSF